MFGNNPFLKNDSLLEAVKGAQHDGECRRAAEAIVNEEFGVYSRKAVVREQLAAYDAALEETYAALREGKLAKKDYDKDGKIESPKDEVWGSRFRAAKAAGKMEEESVDHLGSSTVTKSAPKEDPSLPKSFPGAASSAPTAQRLSNAKAAVTPIKEDEQLDELKQSTVRSYIDKAHARATAAKSTGFKKDYSEKKGKKAEKARAEFGKRTKGLGMAGMRLKEDEQLDEISHGLALKAMKKSEKRSDDEYHADQAFDRLSDYKTHDERAQRLRGHMKKKFGNDKPGRGNTEGDSLKYREKSDRLTHGKRAGLPSARHKNRLKDEIRFSLGKHKKPHLPEGYELDEAKYSAKAARAGEDIGKPGKQFAKIAKKAGEKYGSEERGKKVAGAILAKIRAKHMKEDSSFNSAQVTGKSAINEAGADPSAWAGPHVGGRLPFSLFGGKAMQSQSQQAGTSFGAMKARITSAPAKPSYASQQPSVQAPATTAAPAAAPKPAAAPAKSSTSGQTFAQAFAAARQSGGSKAQFQWTNPKTGKTGTFQAAATKKEYVPMSQQKKVDLGAPKATPASTAPAASSAPLPPRRPTMGPTADEGPKTAEPVATSGVNTPNVNTPSAKPMTATPDAGRSSLSGPNSISVAPEKSSATSPEQKKKAPTSPEPTTAVEQKLNEMIQVGDYKYRIV